jgi:hypothetical protein
MKHYEKLNLVSLIIYAVVFAWNLLYFWVLAGPTGLLDMAIWQFFVLCMLIPAIFTLIHVALKGINKETILVPIIFSLLNQLNFYLTWNLLWFTNSFEFEALYQEPVTGFLISIASSIEGFVIGAVIYGIRRWISSKKETNKAP